jgi:hypothetical protein
MSVHVFLCYPTLPFNGIGNEDLPLAHLSSECLTACLSHSSSQNLFRVELG